MVTHFFTLRLSSVVIYHLISFVVFFLSSKDFVSLDGFLGDISDDEVRHRKSSSHRGPPGRRKPEKVANSELSVQNWHFYGGMLRVLVSPYHKVNNGM